jgi:hypothetical protein
MPALGYLEKDILTGLAAVVDSPIFAVSFTRRAYGTERIHAGSNVSTRERLFHWLFDRHDTN